MPVTDYPLVIATLTRNHPLPWRADDQGYVFDANEEIVGSMGSARDDEFMSAALAQLVCNLANNMPKSR